MKIAETNKTKEARKSTNQNTHKEHNKSCLVIYPNKRHTIWSDKKFKPLYPAKSQTFNWKIQNNVYQAQAWNTNKKNKVPAIQRQKENLHSSLIKKRKEKGKVMGYK